MAAFDLETTGVRVEDDRIVTAAIYYVAPGREPFAWTWLVNPGVGIPAAATRVHGITDRMAADGQPAFEAVDEIAMHLSVPLCLDVPVVVANAAFDLTILDRECRRYMLPTLEDRADRVAPIIDVQVLDKHLDRRKGSRKLENLCEHYGVKVDNAHDALADAKAAARVAWKIAQNHSMVATLPVHQLHDMQVGWRRDQQTSLAAYFRRQGKHKEADGVQTDWPMIPYREPT